MTLTEARDTLITTLLPSGIRYDLDKVQTSPSDRMLETAGDLIEIEQHIDKCIDRLTRDIKLANTIIEQCPSAECRQLLMLRYIAGDRHPLEWTEIGKRMGYSVSHVNGYLHGKAIREARIIWNKVNKP